MVVIVVRFAVVIEPRLHAFGEILAVVHAGVFGFPQVNSLEARIDNRAPLLGIAFSTSPPFRQHQITDIGSFLERIRVHFRGRRNRETSHPLNLGVERRNPIFPRRIEAERLDRHQRSHCRFHLILAAHDHELMTERGGNDVIFPRRDAAIRHSLGSDSCQKTSMIS